jgi:ribonuclease Z
MLEKLKRFVVAAPVLLSAAAIGLGIGLILDDKVEVRQMALVSTAQAAGGKVTDPKGVAPDRYAYYPGTEALKADEIRVIACGTGMPSARRGQAATCFLVETGNGDKFMTPCGPADGQRVARTRSRSGVQAA